MVFDLFSGRRRRIDHISDDEIESVVLREHDIILGYLPIVLKVLSASMPKWTWLEKLK